MAEILSDMAAGIKSLAKLALKARRPSVTRRDRGDRRLIIMGNGPSLAANIADDLDLLRESDTMAVNFAANADEFALLKPKFYLLADPHFFTPRGTDPNVDRLFDRISTLVDSPMTLYVPVGSNPTITNPNVRVEKFNMLGIEGFGWLERWAYGRGLGMPRPRNVLIPALMTGILAGYKYIDILGADHSWLRTLSVDDDNTVVSVQPHFYKDNDDEKERVTAVYRDVRLHEILLSFHIAFKSYHAIERYARRAGVEICNCTPGSYIDAFRRKPLK